MCFLNCVINLNWTVSQIINLYRSLCVTETYSPNKGDYCYCQVSTMRYLSDIIDYWCAASSTCPVDTLLTSRWFFILHYWGLSICHVLQLLLCFTSVSNSLELSVITLCARDFMCLLFVLLLFVPNWFWDPLVNLTPWWRVNKEFPDYFLPCTRQVYHCSSWKKGSGMCVHLLLWHIGPCCFLSSWHDLPGCSLAVGHPQGRWARLQLVMLT